MEHRIAVTAIALIFSVVGLSGCSKDTPKVRKGVTVTSASAAVSAVPNAAAPPVASAAAPAKKIEGQITIATFAIQKLDAKKAGNNDVMGKLAGAIRKYDLVAVQGIDAEDEGVAEKLLGAINEGGGPEYGMLVSEPTGKEKHNDRYWERYAFFHRTTTVDAYSKGKLYDDSADDHFPREPFAADFGAKQGNFNFVAITIRTRPKRALKELEALPKVMEWARESFPDEEDFVLLGDLNADCRHVMPEQLAEIDLHGSKYQWVVPDDSDSVVGERSCAYDRIVVTEEVFRDYAGQWGVDRAFTDEAVSDRWPVWAKFHIGMEGK